MKKLFTVLLMLPILAFSQTRPSLTKTADKVTVLEAKTEEAATKVATLETVMADVSAQIDSLEAEPPIIIKIPTTVSEANDLLVYALGFLQFILVALFGKNLPKRITPFLLSVIIGGSIAVVSYFTSGGSFTILEGVTFFFTIMGIGGGIHNAKKYQAQTAPATAPTP